MADTFNQEELAADPMNRPVLFRCHSLSELMTEPKAKGEVLSVGAKTHIKKLVKEAVFGVRGRVDTKFMRKGLECENDSIELLNGIFGFGLVKNTERRTNQWLSGEPDIVTPGTDVKTSWSIETFPLTSEDGDCKEYEWQCRAYMMLFDKPKWDVAYCLVDTPQHLIGYEDPAIHIVSHIDPRLRVTLVHYERDMALEEKIKTKLTAAQQYFKELLQAVRQQRNVWAVPVAPPAQQQNQDAKSAFANV